MTTGPARLAEIPVSRCRCINHMLVLAKQHICECRNKCTYPSFPTFLNKVSYVYQLEKKLVKSSNAVADRESKWEKFQLFRRGSEN